MADRPGPSYGTPNFEMLGRWMQLDATEDGPFWALNLMKYHAVAQYADGRPGVSGQEADDAYAPLAPLAAIGAVPAFLGEVLDQRLGEPTWDRVGIVRYPSRAAFFAMQQRDDFKVQHVHKEAGMEFTIVMACLPERYAPNASDAGTLVLVVDRGGGSLEAVDGASSVASFAVEGVIVGDQRSFDRARFFRVTDDSVVEALVQAAATADDAHVLVLAPRVDCLVATLVESAPEL